MKITLNDRQAEVEAELAIVARDGERAEDRCRENRAGHERIAVVAGAKSGGGGDVEPRAEMQRHGHARREFDAGNGGGRVDDAVVAMQGAGERVETEIHRDIGQRSAIDGAEARFGRVAQRNAGLHGIYREETVVVERGEIEAVAVEIVSEKNRAADFGIDGVAEVVGEGEAEGERGELVPIGDETPVMFEIGNDFDLLLVTTL